MSRGLKHISSSHLIPVCVQELLGTSAALFSTLCGAPGRQCKAGQALHPWTCGPLPWCSAVLPQHTWACPCQWLSVTELFQTDQHPDSVLLVLRCCEGDSLAFWAKQRGSCCGNGIRQRSGTERLVVASSEHGMPGLRNNKVVDSRRVGCGQEQLGVGPVLGG